METTQERKGWAFYQRPDEPPAIAVTQRDLSILLALHENRFMNTRQLRRLFGESVDRRLKLLFRAGLIDRPIASRIWRMREGGGSQPGICALSSRGEQALIAFGCIEGSAHEWSELNRTLSMLSSKIPHELGVADVRVAFQVACQARPHLRLGPAADLARGQNARGLAIPGEEKQLHPDWPFALVSDYKSKSLLFVELHTGSEPLTRFGSPDLSNLKGKYERYLAYARAKRHIKQFGVSGFRVLTAIEGGERMLDNVVDTAHSVTAGVGDDRFLAIRLCDLQTGDPLTLPWRNAAGRNVALGI